MINNEKTYLLDTENHKIRGMTSGIDAVRQAVYLILNCERYVYPVYSWNYGAELSELIGREASYLWPELKRRITEALTCDDRIIAVEDFDFEAKKDNLTVTFTVKTVFGDIREKKEVEINV